MSFSLKGFSPYLSHIICVFLGVALFNLSSSTCEEVFLSPHKILFPVSEKKFLEIDPKRVYSGQKMMLVKSQKDSSSSFCLMTEKPGKVTLSNQSFFIAVSSSAGKDYLNLLKDKFYLIPYDRSLFLLLCQKDHEVTYGAS